jgi:hypothetical protein
VKAALKDKGLARDMKAAGDALSVSWRTGRLVLYFFNDKTTLNALVCDHSPVYLTIDTKLRDKFLLKLGTSLLDFLKLVREFSNSGKVSSCCML